MTSNDANHDANNDPILPWASYGEISRRSLLRGAGVAGLAALLGPSLAHASQTPAEPGPRVRTRVRNVGDGPLAVQPTPYRGQSSCGLSEDYFLTGDVVIGEHDRVLPFINPFNNAVEAVVFASGSAAHLRRDASTTSGWSYESIITPKLSAVSDVALAGNAKQVNLLLFGKLDGFGVPHVREPAVWSAKLVTADTWDTGGTTLWSTLSDGASLPNGPIKGGVSDTGTPEMPDGTDYYYTSVVRGNQTDIVGWIDDGSSISGASRVFLTVDTSKYAVQDYIVLYDPAAINPTGYAFVLTSDGTLNCFRQSDAGFGKPFYSPNTVASISWAYVAPETSQLAFVFQASGHAWFYEMAVADGKIVSITDLAEQSASGSNGLVTWLQHDLWAVNILDSSGTLNLVQQTSNQKGGTWAPPLPLAHGVAAVYGVPTDPTESTLFLIGADETLSVLTLDESGWTQTQVRQAGASLQEISSYRVQAQVLDANGVGVAFGKASISTDRPVGLWQPTGNTVLNPGAPVTMTANLTGEVSFSIPAEELDCAVLTVQPLDAKGGATGDAFTVTPDTDTQGFLNGTTQLADIGGLSSDALLKALNDDGSAVFPTLTQLTGAARTQAATASVGALTHLIAVGTAAAPSGAGAVQSLKLDLSAAPTFQTSTDPGHFGQLTEGVAFTASFPQLFDSIGHGLRHGAMELKTLVIKWADDAKNWVVNLAVKIGDSIVNFADLAITGMKDAFHAIGGFFHALGADIAAGINWLKHHVLGLLKEAGANAKVIDGWLTAAPGQLTTVTKSINIDVENFFTSKEAEAHTLIQGLEASVIGTFGGSSPPPTPSDDSSSASAQSGLIKDLSLIGKVINDAPGKWLYNKLTEYLPAEAAGPNVPDVFTPVINDLAKVWADAQTFSENLIDLIEATAKEMFATNADVEKAEMPVWFAKLDATVEDGLKLLDQIAQTVLDLIQAALGVLGDFLSYEYSVIGKDSLIGLILSKAGIDIELTLAHLVSLVIAYPATLVSQLLHHDSLFPASATTSIRGRSVADAPGNWQVGLGICAAVTQSVWGLADVAGDLQSLTDPDSGKRGSPASLIDWIDILCPIAETVLLWPSKANADGSTTYPFNGGIATNTKDWGLLPPTIISAITPALFALASKASSPAAGRTTQLQALPNVDDPFADYYSPVVQMVAGIINTACGVAYSAANNSGNAALAGGVLGNVSFILAPLQTKWLNETTEDVPVLIKTVVDAVGNIGAAITIAEATSLPPK